MSDEQIIPSTDQENPGTADGVGERVEQGLGSDGVQRMDGEFAALQFEEPGGTADDTGDTTATASGDGTGGTDDLERSDNDADTDDMTAAGGSTS